jgi:hypothetical protein
MSCFMRSQTDDTPPARCSRLSRVRTSKAGRGPPHSDRACLMAPVCNRDKSPGLGEIFPSPRPAITQFRDICAGG